MIKQCFQHDEDADEKFGKKTGRKIFIASSKHNNSQRISGKLKLFFILIVQSYSFERGNCVFSFCSLTYGGFRLASMFSIKNILLQLFRVKFKT